MTTGTSTPDISLDLSPCATPAGQSPEPRTGNHSPNEQHDENFGIKKSTLVEETVCTGTVAGCDEKEVDDFTGNVLTGICESPCQDQASDKSSEIKQEEELSGSLGREIVYSRDDLFANTAPLSNTQYPNPGAFSYGSNSALSQASFYSRSTTGSSNPLNASFAGFNSSGIFAHGASTVSSTYPPKVGGIGSHRNSISSVTASPFAFESASNGLFQASAFRPSQTASVAPHASGSSGVDRRPPLPTFATVYNTSLTCYLVQFTSGRTDTYYIPDDQSLNVCIGDYVVVEADRGEDLGRVLMDNINVPVPLNPAPAPARRNSTSSVGSASNFMFQDDMYGMNGQHQQQQPQHQSPKRIFRLAQQIEIESLQAKIKDEINAISVGQYKVQEWKLPMMIIDAEYQWDRRKLTFFFSVTNPALQAQFLPRQSVPRIDFRTLVRDLYQIYRTRIWMYCVDKDKTNSNRSHNREKFRTQLTADCARLAATSSSFGSSIGNARAGSFSGKQNSLRALVEQDENDGFQYHFENQAIAVANEEEPEFVYSGSR